MAAKIGLLLSFSQLVLVLLVHVIASTSSATGMYTQSGVNLGTYTCSFAAKMKKPNFPPQKTQLLGRKFIKYNRGFKEIYTEFSIILICTK